MGLLGVLGDLGGSYLFLIDFLGVLASWRLN
jgi:hypothetical protein